MAEAAPTIDALGQFRLHHGWGLIGKSVNFTQANAWMVAGAILTLFLLVYGMRGRAVVPNRLQSLAEMSYEFIEKMCVDQIGEEGRRFFPFIFTLFFFVLMGNLLGLLPFGFTYTSHIAVTAALAIMVIVFVTIVAIRENGSHFFTEYFFPAGAPTRLAPLIIPGEIISYLSRPVSLSIRLFANMVAGHVMFAVFASFVVMMGCHSILGMFAAIGPLAVNVALMGFELLVAALQAYVFAILTCIYLHDAVHLH